MYSKTAQYYDLIYSFKNYLKECEFLREFLLQNHPDAKTLLDVACGTGEHAQFLSQNYDVDGLDLSPEFVAIASDKVPSGKFTQADMCNFKLPNTYDVIICLFSAIGYLTTPQSVINALICFKKHLNPHGIIIIEPWFTPLQWTSGIPHMQTVSRPDLKICRMNTSMRNGTTSTINFHFLIGTQTGVEYVTEEHVLTLYTYEEMCSFFKKAGLTIKFDKEGLSGRGLYMATKPAIR
jgi:SAM-dependent methyltransferase